MNTLFRDVCQVAIIGAGPYGLSLAAHLKAAQIDTRIFGEPMGFWRSSMPHGMRLRSPWNATHIADPLRRFSLHAYGATTGIKRSEPLTREDFIGYGDWFQHQAVRDLDRRTVVRVDLTEGGFLLRLDEGRTLAARRVVVATGLAHQDHRPRQFDGLPRELVSHSCDHAEFDGFAGRRVAIIGSGQSACESAALLAEAGASVELVSRAPIRWLGSVTSEPAYRNLYWRLHGMLATRSGVGPFPLNRLNEAPEAFHRLPRAIRALVNALSPRPGVAGWVKPRMAGVQVDSRRIIFGARAKGERIMLDLDNGSREFDHIMLATGWRVDISRLGFLGQDLLDLVARSDGSPILSDGYESSVPGLHFIGASAAASYGPLLGVVAGAGPAARNVTRFLATRCATRTVLADLQDELSAAIRERAA